MIKLKLLWLDLIGGSVCHKTATWELAVMILLSKAMSKVSGFTLTLPCKAYWPHQCSAYLEIRRISSVCHLLTRKDTVLLMCSCVLSRLEYCNSLLINVNSDQMYRLRKLKSCSQSRFSQKQTEACYTTSPGAPSQRKDAFQDSHLCFSFLWWYPATISVILSLCVHSISYSPFPFRWKNSILRKMETQDLWSPVVLCSGAPCLEQSSSPHQTH